MRVELIGGALDGKLLEVDESTWAINVPIAPGLSTWAADADDPMPAYITITYRFEGSIRDDGTRRFTLQ